MLSAGVREMTQISYAVLIVLGLVFTAYFGAAAWRLSGDDHAEITGTLLPGTDEYLAQQLVSDCGDILILI
jgi:hypothetical protein